MHHDAHAVFDLLDDVVNTLKMTMRKRKNGGIAIAKVESDTTIGDYKIDLVSDDPNDPMGKNCISLKRLLVLYLVQDHKWQKKSKKVAVITWCLYTSVN
jgi:hypothetical protein